MLQRLKNHPFAVDAHFDYSLVLTFAVPPDELCPQVPGMLRLDTFNQQWAFVAMAMVQTRQLRPHGWPRWLGNDFFLIGYRAFVRYTDSNDKAMRGLFILRSETNKRRMSFWGNRFTHYNYRTTDIKRVNHDDSFEIQSRKSGLQVHIGQQGEGVVLPPQSPFSDWKQARQFAGPMPFTFTARPGDQEVLIIEGIRQHWQPQPVEVLQHSSAFIESLQFSDCRLANAFLVTDVPYQWQKGRIDICPQ